MQQSLQFEATAEQADAIRTRLMQLPHLKDVSVEPDADGYIVRWTSRSDATRSVRTEIMLIVGDPNAQPALSGEGE